VQSYICSALLQNCCEQLVPSLYITESHGDQLRSLPSVTVLHFVFISYPNGRETAVSSFFMCMLRHHDLCLLYLEISFEEIHITDYTRKSTISCFEQMFFSASRVMLEYKSIFRHFKRLSRKRHITTVAMVIQERVLLSSYDLVK
jgi:hypothetical protein